MEDTWLAVGPLGGDHLVHDHDELLDAEGVGEQGVLTRLGVLGDAGLGLAGVAAVSLEREQNLEIFKENSKNNLRK